MADNSLLAENSFYQTFLDLVTRVLDRPSGDPAKEHLKDPGFRRFLISKVAFDLETKLKLVKILGESLAPRIVKPQRLIYDASDYYVAVDLLTSTYYICYRTLLMVDIDGVVEDRSKTSTIERIRGYVDRHPDLIFRLYASRNGLHAFLTSHPMDYRSDRALRLMLELEGDFYYVVYSHLRGWSVRLNHKRSHSGDTNRPLYRYLETIHGPKAGPEDGHLVKLVQLHLDLEPTFRSIGLSSML